MSVKSFALAIWFAGAGPLFAQCEAPTPVRELLQKPEFRRKFVETQAQKDGRTAAFRKALSEHPDDYFVLRRQLTSFEDPQQALAWTRDERQQHPDSTIYEMIEAEALLGINTPEAIKQMEALKAAHPDLPRPYLQLASAFGFGKFRDKMRVQVELDGYRKLCPNSLDSSFLNELSRNGSPAQIAPVAASLREQLEAAAGDPNRGQWETLWSLEFKAHPLPEHPAVRKKIAEDLARFEALRANEDLSKRNQVSMQTFLRGGYQSIGDQAAVEKINDEIIEQHPKSSDAQRIGQQRFLKSHPMPPRNDEEKTIAWKRANLAEARAWLTKAPEDSMTLMDVVYDLNELPDTKMDEMVEAIDRFQAAYKKNGDFLTTPPFEWRIAEAYIKFKIHLDQVPALIEDSYRTMMERQNVFLNDDRNDVSDSTDYFKIEKVRILLDYYAVTKDAAKAHEAIASLVLKDAGKVKSQFLALKAKAAEIEGRKLDALMLYRSALDTRPVASAPAGKDKVAEDVERLWEELGGTPEGHALLMEKPKGTEATDSRWEKPKNPLPPFTLTDLQGKTWTLARLEGKTLLINLWATWCGPCMSEHPEFQKLYDELKDRPDVSIFSFNVDDDLGKIAPYIAEHKYTFPVIPAKDVVDAVVPQLAIPRNWLVDAKGKLQWEQIGYGNDGKWEQMMRSKLEELAKSGNATPPVRP
jgi:thiol-disulfide isomerase/thioredoxin